MGYGIIIFQYNAKGSLVFKVETKTVLNKNEDEVLDLTTKFLIDNYDLYQKAGWLLFSANRLKVSYPINLTIVDCENNAEINLRLEGYQKFLRELDNAGLLDLIKTELENAKRPNYFKQAIGAKPPVDIVCNTPRNLDQRFS
jgi:hypothetical protein